MTRVISLALIGLLYIGCSKVPITGRKQLNLLPESQMIGMSLTAYDEFLTQNPPESGSSDRSELIQGMGAKISVAVETYLKDNGMQKRVEGFQWEFNVVEDPAVNAWCMPGGKVVFYTGLMDVADNDDQLAAVMGHEIAHAVARHGNERMSQGMTTQMGASALGAAMSQNPTLTKNLFLQATGIGTQIGMLKFSRNHETEADKMGLIFMAMAGYNPNEAVSFWENMTAASSGGAPPEFLSTHPSHERRISDLQEFMPEAMKYYKKQ